MTETEDLKLKTEMVQKMGAMIFFAEKALRSIALNHAEAARSGVTEALRCLDGKLPNSAPAEPSGNTGELPVCATCCGKGLVNWEPCPDCSAAQPATEQPRIWADHGDVAGIHHSDDNGKTWIDEQAEREGK